MGRKKKPKIPEGQPLWLITFSDLMTLMLTFFVLLVSMSVVDERRKLVVLGSIMGTFGFGSKGYDVLSTTDSRKTVEIGPMEVKGDLETVKPILWEFAEDDLRFESNRFVQIISIGAEVLFLPGGTEISSKGMNLLDKVIVALKKATHPVLLAGHTSTLRDELGEGYRIEEKDLNPDLSWKISLNRVLSVYSYLVNGGIDPEMLKVEAFGRFKPRYPNNSPEDRRKNRRVDIVLDKRNDIVKRDLKEYKSDNGEEKDGNFRYEDFVFPINDPEKN